MTEQLRVGSFQTTRWSLVGRAAGGDERERSAALGHLLRLYEPALRAHLLYRRRLDRHDADDVIQEFVHDKVIVQQLLGGARRERGRFRNFLLVSLDRFLIDRTRARQAAKRSPDSGAAALSGDEPAPASAAGPDRAVELAWAKQLLNDALGRMREECDRLGKAAAWGVFEGRVLNPSLHGAEPVAYEALVERFGFESPRDAANALVNAKRRFVSHLRAAVAEYEGDDADVDAEIQDLHRILSGG